VTGLEVEDAPFPTSRCQIRPIVSPSKGGAIINYQRCACRWTATHSRKRSMRARSRHRSAKNF
jgi:hypothetical protein